jgi:hypothetical protein
LVSKQLAARAWAAAFALALHNGEEVLLGLPAWGRSHPDYAMAIWSDTGFALVAMLLVLAAILFGLWCQFRPHRWQAPLLRLFAFVMLLNTGSHLALSLMTGSLMPGAVTALLVVPPVFLWILLRPVGSPK